MVAIITAQQFIDNGFRVSQQLPQAELDRAAMDAFLCYVGKVSRITVTPNGQILHTPEQGEAAMQIAYILLLQRSAVATRAGGKLKLSPSLSDAGYPSQQDYSNADRLLRRLQEIGPVPVAGDVSKLVDDIAGIYYRNVNLSL